MREKHCLGGLCVDYEACRARGHSLLAFCFAQKAGGAGGIQDVQIRGAGQTSWTNLNNIWGAAWEIGQTPNPPIDVHITEEGGSEVVLSIQPRGSHR
jgi:Expansin C-terminal domain